MPSSFRAMMLQVNTAPHLRWATLQEVKDHLRVTSAAEDAYIAQLIAAVQNYAEKITNRTILTTAYILHLDQFPASKVIELPKPKTQSITHIKYYDSDNALQTLASSQYVTDIISEPARITEASGVTWPTTYSRTNAVQVQYIAGWTAASFIPAGLTQAMLFTAAHFFEFRNPAIVGQVSLVPQTMRALYEPYRVMGFY